MAMYWELNQGELCPVCGDACFELRELKTGQRLGLRCNRCGWDRLNHVYG
jgi:hypothetical protein